MKKTNWVHGLTGALLLGCAGCDMSDQSGKGAAVTPAPSASTSSVALVPLSATNVYGGFVSDGVLVVNFHSGVISACANRCLTIGKISGIDPHDVVMTSGVYVDAYIYLTDSGQVFHCTVETDDDNRFKGGSCEKIGSA